MSAVLGVPPGGWQVSVPTLACGVRGVGWVAGGMKVELAGVVVGVLVAGGVESGDGAAGEAGVGGGGGC